MRRRIMKGLLAATAAGATMTSLGLAAAGSASAAATGHRSTAAHHIMFAPSAPAVATGSALAPCSAVTGFRSSNTDFSGGGCAGYVANGTRNFRYAQAIIRLPQTNVIDPTASAAASDAAPSLYVGLTSGDAMAAAGFMTCTNVVAEFGASGPCLAAPNTPNEWVAVGWTLNNNGGTANDQVISMNGVSPGDGVKFQVYYPAGGAVHFTITTGPTTPAPVSHLFQLPSTGTFNAVFNHADALVDYSASDLGTGRPGLTPGPASGSTDLKITTFQAGAFTTVSGDRGTFKGPWALYAPTVTSNGSLPPSGTINVEPAYLWNDGLGNGWGDAFGVWWRV